MPDYGPPRLDLLDAIASLLEDESNFQGTADRPNFTMSHFWHDPWPSADFINPCGFSACAIGHGIVRGILPDLHIRPRGTKRNYHGVHHRATGTKGFHAVALVFNIEHDEAQHLFSAHWPGEPPDHVAERLRDFIAARTPAS